MVSKEEIKNELNKWVKLFDNPEFAAEFEGYNKTFQFIFPDINYNLQMIFENKKARLEEGLKENAEMSLEVNSDMFYKMTTGEIDPMEAFLEGTLKPKGSMADLEKLEIFLDAMDED
ncbi:MAG: SCP2 sterol-binding domain-containing protein [Promethearchaeota archaeon]